MHGLHVHFVKTTAKEINNLLLISRVHIDCFLKYFSSLYCTTLQISKNAVSNLKSDIKSIIKENHLFFNQVNKRGRTIKLKRLYRQCQYEQIRSDCLSNKFTK